MTNEHSNERTNEERNNPQEDDKPIVVETFAGKRVGKEVAEEENSPKRRKEKKGAKESKREQKGAKGSKGINMERKTQQIKEDGTKIHEQSN